MKRILLYSFFLTLIFGCDDAEKTYSPKPNIETGKIEFVEGHSHIHPRYDTIAVQFTFSDGDFNLGLDHVEMDSPYHTVNFFLEKNGQTQPVVPKIVNDRYVISASPAQTGKLVTYRRAVNFITGAPQYSCDNYFYGSAFVSANHIIDASYNLKDTLLLSQQNIYEVLDTFLIEKNINHHNLYVDYFVEQNNGTYELFNWSLLFCVDYSARFFPLSSMPVNSTAKNGPYIIKRTSKQTGSIRYAMPSIAFKTLFSGKRIKLRFSIIDRELNQSNIFESAPIVIP